jgi:hypothetical protein
MGRASFVVRISHRASRYLPITGGAIHKARLVKIIQFCAKIASPKRIFIAEIALYCKKVSQKAIICLILEPKFGIVPVSQFAGALSIVIRGL